MMKFFEIHFEGHKKIECSNKINIISIWKASDRFPQPGYGYLLLVQCVFKKPNTELRILPHQYRCAVAGIVVLISLILKGPTFAIIPVVAIVVLVRDYLVYLKKSRIC